MTPHVLRSKTRVGANHRRAYGVIGRSHIAIDPGSRNGLLFTSQLFVDRSHGGEIPMQWVLQLDRILRGEATTLPSLRKGIVNVSAGGLLAGLIGMGAVYGVCMASFTMF